MDGGEKVIAIPVKTAVGPFVETESPVIMAPGPSEGALPISVRTPESVQRLGISGIYRALIYNL
jgi:hypothetical protein